MNWYSVTIKDKGAKPMRGSSYVQAEDEEKVKEIAREYMTNYLSLQGVRTIKVHGKIEDGEKEVKQLVLGGGNNGMIYNDGKYVHRGDLKDN